VQVGVGRTGWKERECRGMQAETRLERRFDRALAHATTPRGAALIIASVTTAITIAAGMLMTVVDHDNFPSVGSGLWWAVQTITTVGYGDLVPTSIIGRVLAAGVMLLGIGFVTVITAAITSSFVARSRQELAGDGDDSALSQLRAIDERLQRIEAALSTRS
jgi:voltage-gated potassium channel